MKAGMVILGLLLTGAGLAQEKPAAEEEYFPRQMTARELL